jgi:ubiquinone biosynthesis protein UbiJ
VVAVRVRDTALAAYFVIDDVLDVVTSSPKDPDVVITGSILTLAKMAGQSGEAAIRDGSLDLTGDAETAGQFQQLLSLAKLDLEEELSGIVGDVAAHRLGEIARGVSRWGRSARSTMGANIREYLQEESRDAPSRDEVDRFGAAVSTLRDDVDRIEARLNRLRDEN